MANQRMHADEVTTDVELVRRLIAGQFPAWSSLPITPVTTSGTDNAIYRLGKTMAVRLPRRPDAVSQVEKEHEWLPRLAPLLPLAVPEPLARGMPAEGYPWQWSVTSWLDGETPDLSGIGGSTAAAAALAGFIRALQSVDSSGGPEPGVHNSYRGAPLARRDLRVREALAQCGGLVDVGAAMATWERAMAASAWTSAPVWLHGDLLPSNLLTKDGRLNAVIDFGMLGIGDPACDLLPAWAIFEGEARETFRAGLDVDGATWERGRGWALSWAVIALPYYLHTNRAMVAMASRTLDALLEDPSR